MDFKNKITKRLVQKELFRGISSNELLALGGDSPEEYLKVIKNKFKRITLVDMKYAYSVNINGVSYALKEGITIKEVANENLDNAVAVIPQVAEIASLEPYDIAAIYDGTTLIKKLLVGDITSTIASFTPALYNYFLLVCF